MRCSSTHGFGCHVGSHSSRCFNKETQGTWACLQGITLTRAPPIHVLIPGTFRLALWLSTCVDGGKALSCWSSGCTITCCVTCAHVLTCLPDYRAGACTSKALPVRRVVGQASASPDMMEQCFQTRSWVCPHVSHCRSISDVTTQTCSTPTQAAVCQSAQVFCIVTLQWPQAIFPTYRKCDLNPERSLP